MGRRLRLTAPQPGPPAVGQAAEAIKDWVADPALKSFVLRIADQSLDDLLWLESMVALLTQKPPSGWRDDDRREFEVALTNMARLFEHVERLAFAETPAGSHSRMRRMPFGSGSPPVPTPEFGASLIHISLAAIGKRFPNS